MEVVIIQPAMEDPTQVALVPLIEGAIIEIALAITDMVFIQRVGEEEIKKTVYHN